MSNLLCIGHVHLKVSDLKKVLGFYKEMLGFKVSERVNGYVFLTLGKKHHDLALQELANVRKPSENSIGLYHFAIELKNVKDLAKLYFKLKNGRVNLTSIDQGISKCIYFSDPEGNGIEVYVDTRHNRKKWKGLSKIIPEIELKNWLKK